MGLRKRTWKTKNGFSTRYEFSYILDGKQVKKTFKKKPSIEELAKITYTIPDNPYLKDAFDDYISYCSLHCKDSTIETYNNYKKIALKPFWKLKLKNANQMMLSKILTELKKDYAPKSYNNILMFLKGFFNYCVDNKKIAESPLKKIKSQRLGKRPAKALNDEVRDCFIKKAFEAPFWVYVFFMTMLEMGLRISECIALEWGDINYKTKKMNINKQYYRMRLTSTKNYETRELDIPENLLELYKQLSIDSELIFSSTRETGGYPNTNNIRKHFDNIIEKVENDLSIDLSGVTPHCLRHTHATYLLSNGIPLKYVSERLGHKDTKTTLNIYNHVLPTDNKKALEVLNRINLKKSENRAKNKNVG